VARDGDDGEQLGRRLLGLRIEESTPEAVVPPLRSVRTGVVCDRWAIDVAGPLPVTASGKRYVIAAVEYTTRYAVAEAVTEHTAKAIARFLMERVVLVFGPMREIMMDGAREFGSQATAELLQLMQTKQSTPVPYRPNLLGLVERFHRTWKDIVSLYVDEGQDDWDDFVPCALYAYNSARHATHGYQPNELMMGRKLRTPAELLRRSRLTHPRRTLNEYHEALIEDLRMARELAALALQKEQARQAMYYNQRKERDGEEFRVDQLVWVYRPARGPGITKFGHRWRGPAQIIEAAGYDNYKVKMLESGNELVTHCSFLLSYYYPTHLLEKMAEDIADNLREEAVAAADIDPDEEGGESPEIDAPGTAENSPTASGGEAAAEPTTTEGVTTRPATEDEAQARDAEPRPDAAPERDGSDARDAEQLDAEQQPASSRKRAAPTQSTRSREDAAAGASTDGPPRQRRKRVRVAATDAGGDTIASRTRARARRAPGSSSKAGSDQRGDSRRRAEDAAEPRREADSSERGRADGDAAPEAALLPENGAAREPVPEAEEASQQPRQRPAVGEEDEEPIIYVFAGQGRRGADSLVSRRPRLAQLQPGEAVRERRRRRYRTRTGRYILEFEMERLGDRFDRPVPKTLWINQADYEELWRDGRVRVTLASEPSGDHDDEASRADAAVAGGAAPRGREAAEESKRAD
jgi:hypothetical protein